MSDNKNFQVGQKVLFKGKETRDCFGVTVYKPGITRILFSDEENDIYVISHPHGHSNFTSAYPEVKKANGCHIHAMRKYLESL